MRDLVLTVLGGLLIAFGAHQIARGGLRWRSLSVAGHELDVAAKLPPGDALADELHLRARARIEAYIRDRGPWHSRPGLAFTAAAIEFAGGVGSVAVALFVDGGWFFLLLAVAFFLGAVEAASRAIAPKEATAHAPAGSSSGGTDARAGD